MSRERFLNVMETLAQDIETSFPHLGLGRDFTNKLTEKYDHGINETKRALKAVKHFAKGNDDDETLAEDL